MKKNNYIILDLKNKAFLQTVLIVILISVSVLTFQSRRNINQLNKEVFSLKREIRNSKNSINALENRCEEYELEIERMKRQINDLERDGDYWW